VDLGILPKEVLDDARYYHRQVMEYANLKNRLTGVGPDAHLGPDTHLRKKGYQKDRKGGGDFNTAYEQAEFEYLTHAYKQIAAHETIARVKKDFDIAGKLRAEHGDQWQDNIPEGHTLWSPKEGTEFARVMTVNEAVVQKLLSGMADELGDVKVREMFARVAGKLLALPEHIAKQLDATRAKPDTFVENMAASAMASWKQWTLLNPARALKYNINNFTGDMDGAMAADPRILLGVVASVKDLARDVRQKASPEVATEIREAREMGVIGGGMTSAEIPDISQQGVFRSLTGGKNNPVEWSWNALKGGTQIREDVLRLAAYRRALAKIERGETFYWASKRAMIDAISSPKEKAAQLARDLMGDYGNISAAGQTIRQRYIPFYSWMEVNAKRYYRLFENAAADGRVGRTGAMASLTVGRKLAVTGAKAVALYSLVHMFNAAMFPEHDDGFADGRLRLLVGTTSDGKAIGIRFQGAFSDILGWADLQNLPGMVEAYSRGDKSAGDIAKDMAKAAPNRIVNAALPVPKVIGELAMGRSLFPDIFDPTPIRDRGEHAARFVGADSVYRAVKDIPQGGAAGVTTNMVASVSDLQQQAMRRHADKVEAFMAKNDISRSTGGEPTERSNALYYFKKAKQQGNDEQAERWMKRYMDAGGSMEKAVQNIRRSAINSIPVFKRNEFIRSLSPAERADMFAAKDAQREMLQALPKDWQEHAKRLERQDADREVRRQALGDDAEEYERLAKLEAAENAALQDIKRASPAERPAYIEKRKAAAMSTEDHTALVRLRARIERAKRDARNQ
jgi:hypothetical protein